jgi:hypothetical protein
VTDPASNAPDDAAIVIEVDALVMVVVPFHHAATALPTPAEEALPAERKTPVLRTRVPQPTITFVSVAPRLSVAVWPPRAIDALAVKDTLFHEKNTSLYVVKSRLESV